MRASWMAMTLGNCSNIKMAGYIRETVFDPWFEIQRYQDTVLDQMGKYGALASFVGTMRDNNQGHPVQAMELEHYPEMAEKFLTMISAEAARRWSIFDSLIIHRYGNLRPNEPIVVIAVWSAHRAAAFDACRYLIEELKTGAPFWKKETLPTGKYWVRPSST